MKRTGRNLPKNPPPPAPAAPQPVPEQPPLSPREAARLWGIGGIPGLTPRRSRPPYSIMG
ncbi:MAG TPA: hypothetical protein VK251_03695 [Steroidobacteraceae bacterium]|nr:hypothetical protein [Steroidobacteraceae bacterium]